MMARELNSLPWEKRFTSSIKALIVEDDICMQAHLATLIRRIDYYANVEKVSTAEEARDRLDSNNEGHYTLVIADQYLDGGATGLDLWRYCCQFHPEVRFILTSGEVVKNLLNRVAVTPSPNFLLKPFSIQQAVEKIQDSLGKTHLGFPSDMEDSLEIPYEFRSLKPFWGFVAAIALLVFLATSTYKERAKSEIKKSETETKVVSPKSVPLWDNDAGELTWKQLRNTR